MKETLAKLFVPLIAAAGGLGGFLVEKNWVAAEEGKEISLLAERTVDSAAGLITAVALAVVAMVVKRFFAGSAREVDGNQRGGSGTGGVPLVVALGAAAALLMGPPSCAHLDGEVRVVHDDPESGVSVGVVVRPRVVPSEK